MPEGVSFCRKRGFSSLTIRANGPQLKPLRRSALPTSGGYFGAIGNFDAPENHVSPLQRENYYARDIVQPQNSSAAHTLHVFSISTNSRTLSVFPRRRSYQGPCTMLSDCAFPLDADATKFAPHGMQESWNPTFSIELKRWLVNTCVVSSMYRSFSTIFHEALKRLSNRSAHNNCFCSCWIVLTECAFPSNTVVLGFT